MTTVDRLLSSRTMSLIKTPLFKTFVAGLALAATATAAPQASRSLPGVGLRTLLGRPGGAPMAMSPQSLRTSQATTAWLTSIATPALSAPVLIPGIGGTAYVLRLFVPETGNEELFTLHVPDSPPGQARPLLVGFHGYGVSHLDFSYYNTSFLSEADARDWFVLAPIQINPLLNTGDLSFGSADSQLNVRAVMEYTLANWPIDLDRIYGVGFSMGGGNAVSYGARHRNRERGAFSAIVNHTGATSASDVWVHEPAIRAPLEVTFGGPPPGFEYARSSAVELSLADGSLVQGGRHMATNLAGVAVRSYYFNGDPKAYLRDQSDRLDEFMSATPGLSHELIVETTSPCPNSPNPNHCWDLLDEPTVLDWLATQSLGPPPLQGRILADRAERWNGFDLEQHAPGAFSSLDYDLVSNSTSPSQVSLMNRENTSVIGLDLAEFGLDATVGVQLQTFARDGLPVTISIQGLVGPPAVVRRNNLQVPSDCGPPSTAPRWCFDAASGTLELHEPTGSFSRWSVTP